MASLPIELWTQVVDGLDEKDVDVVSTVCKALRVFSMDRTIRISLKDDQYEELLEDLTRFPSFAARISQFTMETENVIDNVYTFRDILNSCGNLQVLIFTGSWIRCSPLFLCSEKTKLPHIQRIQVTDLLNASGDMRRFNVLFNYQFRDTIRSLEIVDKMYDQSLDAYGGVIKYTSHFPQLTHIKVNGADFWPRVLDLDQLLAQHPNLEALEIDGLRINGDLSTLAEAPYPSLKELRVDRASTDFTMLTYILTRFTNLRVLRFVQVNVEEARGITDEEVESIIERFTLLKRDKVDIWYIIGIDDHRVNDFIYTAEYRSLRGL